MSQKGGSDKFGSYALLWMLAVLLAGLVSQVPVLGKVLVALVLIFAGFLHFGIWASPPDAQAPAVRRRPSSHRTPRPPTRSAVTRSGSSKKANSVSGHRASAKAHLAPPPQGLPVEPWSQRRSGIEVVGEFYRQDAFRRLFQGVNISGYEGADMTLPAALADDSGNPHDKRAVSVWVSGQHVGYLDRDAAREWHPTVSAMAAAGEHLVVPSRIWASTARGEMSARVTLYAPGPGQVRPINPLPSEPHLVLTSGSTVQVTQEDRHMDVLNRYVTGEDIPVAVTLHAIHEIRPRSAYEAVEVKLDGERVGVLTRTQSENMLPLVKHVEDRGKVPVARATLKGNQLKADITLHVVKAQDADAAWLESLGPATAPKVRAVRPEYEWDD